MASIREQVIEAVLAKIVAALPNATVKRNPSKPSTVAAGGLVVVRDGDVGDPEVTLNPVTYVYSHRLSLELTPYPSAGQTPEQVIDTMLDAIGAAVAADRTLGGLCDYIDTDAPDLDPFDALGAAPGLAAEAGIIATYGTTRPL